MFLKMIHKIKDSFSPTVAPISSNIYCNNSAKSCTNCDMLLDFFFSDFIVSCFPNPLACLRCLNVKMKTFLCIILFNIS